jgi:hypothetical protein
VVVAHWRNRFVDAGQAAMEIGMPGKADHALGHGRLPGSYEELVAAR